MEINTSHVTLHDLGIGLPDILSSPKDRGELLMIVRRPEKYEREVLTEAQLDLAIGLVGDNWLSRGYSGTPDGKSHPDMQITLMNSRLIHLIAREKERWKLAGDQLYADLDLSIENLPPGTRLAIGTAIIEVTAQPHTGCKKFVERFGLDAMKFISTPEGKQLRLRGLNAKVVKPGTIRIGDIVQKLL